jgi:hypothetical protein
MDDMVIREFWRWRNAPAARRPYIANEQAANGTPTLEQMPRLEGGLETIVANGKPLGDCTKEDLADLEEWERALADAHAAAAARLEKLRNSGPWRPTLHPGSSSK